MSAAVIGIDLGGTRIKGVLLDSQRNVLEQLYTPTNDDELAGWRDAVLECVNSLQSKAGSQQLPVGISAPGLPNASNTSIAFMPGRLQGLENFDGSALLKHPAFVCNDAVAALLS